MASPGLVGPGANPGGPILIDVAGRSGSVIYWIERPLGRAVQVRIRVARHDRDSFLLLRAGADPVIDSESTGRRFDSCPGRSRSGSSEVEQFRTAPPRPQPSKPTSNRAPRERRCAMSYLKRHGTRRVPQWAPIPGSGQVPNSAGGFAWAVDDWTRLRRFLILGSEGGSYYAARVDAHARERAGGRALHPRGRRARGRGDRARSARRAGRRRTTRRCSRWRWPPASATRRRARPRSRRCRGWRARARTCSSSRRSWSSSAAGAARCAARSAAGTPARPVDALAYQAVKYRQRDGVTHRDLLRLAHPAGKVSARQPDARRLAASTRRCSSGSCAAPTRDASAAHRRRASSLAQAAETPKRAAELVREYGLPREAVQAGAPHLRRRSGRRCSRTCR